MSDHTHPRKDIASFNISFNLPPEVITAYFDGLAEVEAAKRAPVDGQKSSGIDWSSVLSFFVPIVTSYLASSIDKSSMVKFPVIKVSNASNCIREDKPNREQMVNAIRDQVTDELGPLSKDEEQLLQMIIEQQNLDKSKGDKSEKSKGDNPIQSESKPSENTAETSASKSIFGTMDATSMLKMFGPLLQEITTVLDPPSKEPVIKSEEIKSEEIKSEEVKSEEVKSEEVKSEEVKSEEIKSEEVETKKRTSMPGNNLFGALMKEFTTALNSSMVPSEPKSFTPAFAE